MKYAQGLKKGASLCFNYKYDIDELRSMHSAGIDAVELSFQYNYYMNELDIVNNWQKYVKIAQESGVELWSLHLPFSQVLDISSTDDESRAIVMHTHRELIKVAGKMGIKVAVLHPSSEPIADAVRPERIRRSREAIIELCRACDAAGVRLAVENLPRSCLCNRSEEMIELLCGTNAGIVFDTNHSLFEENVSFLTRLVDSGIEILSLHVSDYDFVDERHRLPGDGGNNWTGLMAHLERCGYNGPLMYEVPSKPKERDAISIAQLAQNMQDLAEGRIV